MSAGTAAHAAPATPAAASASGIARKGGTAPALSPTHTPAIAPA